MHKTARISGTTARQQGLNQRASHTSKTQGQDIYHKGTGTRLTSQSVQDRQGVGEAWGCADPANRQIPSSLTE